MPKSTPTAKNLLASTKIFERNVKEKLQPFSVEQEVIEDFTFITSSLATLEILLKAPDAQDPAEIDSKFRRAEKLFGKNKEKLTDIQDWLHTQRKTHADKLLKLGTIKPPKKPTPAHETNKISIEEKLKATLLLVENAQKGLIELNTRGEIIQKHLLDLKPKITGFSLSERLSQCEREIKKFDDTLLGLIADTSQISFTSSSRLKDMLPRAISFLGPMKLKVQNAANAFSIIEDNLNKNIPLGAATPAAPVAITATTATVAPTTAPTTEVRESKAALSS